MLIESVVASTALFITAVATAIALWECIRHHKDAADPETHALESIRTNDIGLDGQVLHGTINEGLSHVAHTCPSRSADLATYREIYELDANPSQNAIRQAEDRYSNAV